MDYWAKRQAEAHLNLAEKSHAAVQAQLKTYYRSASDKLIKDFEILYTEVINSLVDGNISANDLYKLDRYYKLQTNIQAILRDLGDKEIKVISKGLEGLYANVFKSTVIPGTHLESYSIVNTIKAQLVSSEIWTADAKSWSQRVWLGKAKLQETLERGLVDTLLRGAKTSELKAVLQERFGVSYYEANRLVRTEMAHVQTQAAADRYKEAGITGYEILVESDNHTCDDCQPATYSLDTMETGVNAPPFHPNCRCAIIPILKRE